MKAVNQKSSFIKKTLCIASTLCIFATSQFSASNAAAEAAQNSTPDVHATINPDFLYELFEIAKGGWELDHLADDAHKMADPTNELYCKQVIENLRAAGMEPDAALLKGCEKWLHPKDDEKEKSMKSLSTAAGIRDAFDGMADSAKLYRYFSKKVLNIRAHAKSGKELLPSGYTLASAATIVGSTIGPDKVGNQKLQNDMEGYFYLLQVASTQHYGLSDLDIYVLNLAYDDIAKDVADDNESIRRHANMLGFVIPPADQIVDAAEISAVLAEPNSLSAKGGKVQLTVLLDDQESELDGTTVRAQIKSGSKELAEVELSEELNNTIYPKMRVFSGVWKAPINRKVKAVSYAVSASVERKDSHQEIDTTDDQLARVTVAAAKKKPAKGKK